jgi:uncharacterized protein YidB (DUF937 family)
VNVQVEAISNAIVKSGEYTSRGRTNSQFVGDLYNSFLRRGGESSGVNFWIGQLDTSSLDRSQVRQAFVASPEFQGRVSRVVSEGCLPGY